MDLTGPRAKLHWSFQHLKLVDSECSAILESKPFRITSEFDQESGCHVLYFRMRPNVFPLHLSLRIGDVIHSARSALDQAVWLIACRSNPIDWLWEKRIGRQISFPVLDSEKDFPGHRLMPFITDDAKAVLDALQPYKGGDIAEAMRDLDTLWNIDKHRVIHKSVAQLDLTEVRFMPGGLRIEDMAGPFPEFTRFELPNPLVDGAKVASYRFKDGAGPPETRVDVNGEPTAEVAFGGGYFAMSIDVIGGLLVQANNALSLIEGLADEAPQSEAARKAVTPLKPSA